MLNLFTTNVAIALGSLAIAALVLLKLFPRKPRRAEKWEKAEIMKQLLALSEQEDGRRVPTPAARPRTETQTPTARASQAHPKTAAKPGLAVGAKAR